MTREQTVTLTVEQWCDVESALHWAAREPLTAVLDRAAYHKLELEIIRQRAAGERSPASAGGVAATGVADSARGCGHGGRAWTAEGDGRENDGEEQC